MTKHLLYVGAGHDRGTPFPDLFAGYEVVRLDADPSTEPDITLDALKLSDHYRYTANRFDAVALAHTLEHFTEQEGAEVLRGCHHVLAPGGLIGVSVPNLRWAAALAATDPDTIAYIMHAGFPVRAADMIYGWQRAISDGDGHPLMCHKWGYNARTLKAALHDAGFVKVTVTSDEGPEATEIRAVGRKP